MKLIDEVTIFLKNNKQVIYLFSFLNKFIEGETKDDYVRAIKSLYDDLTKEVLAYNLNKSNTTYNLIDHNFETINDLIKEYKDLYYPLFNVGLLTLFTNLKEEEIKYILDHLYLEKEINVKTSLMLKLYSLCEYFNEEEKLFLKAYICQSDLTYEQMEKVILKMKMKKKELNNQVFNNEYLLTLGLYFAQTVRE